MYIDIYIHICILYVYIDKCICICIYGSYIVWYCSICFAFWAIVALKQRQRSMSSSQSPVVDDSFAHCRCRTCIVGFRVPRILKVIWDASRSRKKPNNQPRSFTCSLPAVPFILCHKVDSVRHPKWRCYLSCHVLCQVSEGSFGGQGEHWRSQKFEDESCQGQIWRDIGGVEWLSSNWG